MLKDKLKKKIDKFSQEKRALLIYRMALEVSQQNHSDAKLRVLSGFVIPKSGETVDGEQLLQYLADQLPDYMIPSIIQMVEEFPRTPNGKIDRKTLEKMANHTTAHREIVSPQNDLETVLLGVWQEALNQKSISVTDNFFRLGGHSLLVTALISKIRDLFELEVPLSSVFDAPTIEKLANWMKTNLGEPGEIEQTATLILQVSGLSDEEVEAMLKEKGVERRA